MKTSVLRTSFLRSSRVDTDIGVSMLPSMMGLEAGHSGRRKGALYATYLVWSVSQPLAGVTSAFVRQVDDRGVRWQVNYHETQDWDSSFFTLTG